VLYLTGTFFPKLSLKALGMFVLFFIVVLTLLGMSRSTMAQLSYVLDNSKKTFQTTCVTALDSTTTTEKYFLWRLSFQGERMNLMSCDVYQGIGNTMGLASPYLPLAISSQLLSSVRQARLWVGGVISPTHSTTDILPLLQLWKENEGLLRISPVATFTAHTFHLYMFTCCVVIRRYWN
jgi:hypothetical protein